MAAVLLTASVAVWAEDTDAEYVRIYNQIQQADEYARTGRPTQARQSYEAAREALLSLQRREPNWTPRVVEFRLRYIADKLSALSAPPAETPAAPPTASPPAPAAVPPAAPPAAPAIAPPPQTAAPTETVSELAVLQERVRQLEADKILLTARLREALAGQPAAVDPRELAKAEEKIRAQQKEIEQLRAERSRPDTESPKKADAAALESSQRALAQARQELATQGETLATLAREKEGLQTLLRSFTKPEEAQALRDENARLKQQLDERAAAGPGTVTTQDLQRRLAALQTALNEEQSRADLLRAEKRVLEQRITELNTQRETELNTQTQKLREALTLAQQEKASLQETNQALQLALAEARRSSSASGKPTTDELSAVELERDELRRKFDAVSRELMNQRLEDRTAEFARLTNELATLKARLDTLEAQPVPYSKQELALFKKPSAPAPKATAKRAKTPKAEPAPVSNTWTSSTERGSKPASAEPAHEPASPQPKAATPEVTALANQAARSLEQRQFDQAEASLKQALAASPNDATCLSLLGRLRYEQERTDEALDALSRSAQLDPQNAETYNYLGLTLSRKGLREPAKSALRRAVLLAPTYGSAHHNLAVAYATQEPPSFELARYHYQKARAAGEPADLKLEELLAGTGVGSAKP
jgi:Flp pilus assembly protein TadD